MLGKAVPLHDWQNFYFVVGGASGALTGLMFVVITLNRESRTSRVRHGMRSYATPTIVHFSSVLGLSAILSMPIQRSGTLGAILLLFAVAALAYMAFVIWNARKRLAYEPDWEDRAWHFLLPPLAYASILVAGAISGSSPRRALFLVGGSMLALLITGIHNAWDSAVWIATRDSEPSS